MNELTRDQHQRISKLYEQVDKVQKIIDDKTESIRVTEKERSHFIQNRQELENLVSEILKEQTNVTA